MDSVRQTIVSLFYEVLNGTPPIFVDGQSDLAKARLANQLIKSGYLDGSAAIGRIGQVMRVAILDVTIEGRRYCDQLENEIRDAKLRTKTGKTIKKGLLILGGAVGGIILTVLTQWILARLNLK